MKKQKSRYRVKIKVYPKMDEPKHLSSLKKKSETLFELQKSQHKVYVEKYSMWPGLPDFILESCGGDGVMVLRFTTDYPDI